MDNLIEVRILYSDESDKQKCSKLPTKQHVHVKTSHIGSFARMTVYTIYISIWNLIKYFFETNNEDSYLSSAIPHDWRWLAQRVGRVARAACILRP